jgi:hypothetical protein
MAYAGSRLKPTDCPERHRLESQPSSRTGENPPYGMTGRIEETSASYEARSAPRSYPTSISGPRPCSQGIRRITVITHPIDGLSRSSFPASGRRSIIKLTTRIGAHLNQLLKLFHQTMQRTNDFHLGTSSVASRDTVAAK